MSIELMMPSNHLILCHPLFFLPSIFPSIKVFSKQSALHIRWSKFWSFSFIINPSIYENKNISDITKCPPGRQNHPQVQDCHLRRSNEVPDPSLSPPAFPHTSVLAQLVCSPFLLLEPVPASLPIPLWFTSVPLQQTRSAHRAQRSAPWKLQRTS